MKKNYALILAVFSIFFIGINLASASVTGTANLTKTEYAMSEKIQGTVTINLTNQPGSSNLKVTIGGNTQTIGLLDFLNATSQVSSITYLCSPADCSSAYSATGTLPGNKTLNSGENMIGFKLTGSNVSFTSLNFSITGTSSGSNCNGRTPLWIDFFNDSSIELEYKGKGDFCLDGILYPGSCYDRELSSYNDSSASLTMPYCEKKYLFKTEKLKLGAIVKKSGSGSPAQGPGMFVYDPDTAEKSPSCYIDKDSITENYPDTPIPCATDLEYSINESKDYFICLTGADVFDLKTEMISPYCGVFASGGMPSSIDDNSGEDFAIYASEASIAELNETKLFVGNSLLKTLIDAYLEENYGDNCSGTLGCVIPMKISSTQSLTLGNLNLAYQNSQNAMVRLSEFSDAEKTSALISMNQTTLSLAAANFTAPNKIGTYDLNFAIDSTALGITEKITVKNVTSSKSQVRTDIDTKRTNLQSLSKGISNLSSKYYAYSGKISQEFTKAGIDISSLNASLNSIENASLQADADWDSLKSRLDSLSIPSSLQIIKYNEIAVPIDTAKISPSFLAQLGAGSAENLDEETIKNAVATWQNGNIAIKASVEGVSAKFPDNKTSDIITFFTLKITPQKDFEEVFFAVSLPNQLTANAVAFDKNYTEYSKQALDGGFGFKFSSMKSGQTVLISFAMSGLHDYIDTGFYASPVFSALPISESVSCGNTICEKNLGETKDTCPEDCKPMNPLIPIIIFSALALVGGYFALRWYYKKYYEKHLFKIPVDIQNITIFIRAAQSHGLDEAEIRKKLKEAGWQGEQVDFAYSKLKSQASGSANTGSNFPTRNP